ncbi:MarR family transcriptional regulator [Mammaliicoccus sciuri]|uniref:MarR family transcriptional regulator n=1 Tax=Mammaliicoccus sciuri TaxID=1296 RepID=UPI002DB854C1|nr:helix-turn-helix domain-containing protein [Mammaliicoccus sciuri]MEB7846352.1 MarR family winged helix-turn-helix transcriptional regulator [Mammaliicoccus sciuri]
MYVGLTKNRYEVLNFINRCGIVSLKQLKKVFTNMSRQNLHATRKQLIELGYIEEITLSFEKLYLITTKGTKECNYYLKGLNFNSVILNHTLIVNEVLINELGVIGFDEDNYKTERDIKQSYYVSGTFERKILDKIPDFIIMSNGKQKAYEVELSLKKQSRLDRKINDYFNLILDETYVQIVYICGNKEVESHVMNSINTVYAKRYQDLVNDDDIFTLNLVRDSFKVSRLS